MAETSGEHWPHYENDGSPVCRNDGEPWPCKASGEAGESRDRDEGEGRFEQEQGEGRDRDPQAIEQAPPQPLQEAPERAASPRPAP